MQLYILSKILLINHTLLLLTFVFSLFLAAHFGVNMMTQSHILHPELKIDKVSIPVVTECKFLGLILDKKLYFISHLKYLKERCMKAMNLMMVVAHKGWGADCATLLKLYRSHIRSKLDYGCIVYGSARVILAIIGSSAKRCRTHLSRCF